MIDRVVVELSDEVDEMNSSKLPIKEVPKSMICVTVYNESLTSLTGTLLSLLRSIRQAQINHIDAASGFCIVIVIDGLEQADPELIACLERHQMIDLEQSCESDNQFFTSNITLENLLVDKALTTPYDRQSTSCIVCVKKQNRGKLHSHYVFFEQLCSRYQPEFCFQIDVGTTVAPKAISKMLNFLEANPSLASAASTIVVSPDQAQGSIVGDWQFMDFAVQAAVNWNAEILAGHLSVLPGQFSVIRWQAIYTNKEPAQDAVAPIQSHIGHDVNNQPPLERYLRGLDVDNDMEQVMFLAEDRIIGNEILLAEDKWRLGFCSEAKATTDACVEMTELCRQRRRWNNSSTACKFWLFGRWRNYLSRSDRSFTEKLRFSSAMVWQFLLILHQLLAPAFLVCVIVLGLEALHALQATEDKWLLSMLYLSAGVGAVLSTPIKKPARLLSLFTKLSWLRSVCMFIVSMVLIYSLILLLPMKSALFMLLPPALAVCMACFVFKRQWLTVLVKAPEYLILVNPAMLATLWCYAVANLSDVTWGTKGLTQSQSRTKKRDNLSMTVLGIWLLINALVVTGAFIIPPLFFTGLNPYLEMRFAIGSLMVALAISLQLGKAYASCMARDQHATAAVNMRGNINV